MDASGVGALEHGFEFSFAEAEPLVGAEFAGFFRAALDEVEDEPRGAPTRRMGGDPIGECQE